LRSKICAQNIAPTVDKIVWQFFETKNIFTPIILFILGFAPFILNLRGFFVSDDWIFTQVANPHSALALFSDQLSRRHAR